MCLAARLIVRGGAPRRPGTFTWPIPGPRPNGPSSQYADVQNRSRRFCEGKSQQGCPPKTRPHGDEDHPGSRPSGHRRQGFDVQNRSRRFCRCSFASGRSQDIGSYALPARTRLHLGGPLPSCLSCPFTSGSSALRLTGRKSLIPVGMADCQIGVASFRFLDGHTVYPVEVRQSGTFITNPWLIYSDRMSTRY